MTEEIFQMPPSFYSEELREILELSYAFDGYEAFGDTLADVANFEMKQWKTTGKLSPDLNLLRACLFFEGRRRKFVSGYPAEEDMPYLRALRDAVSGDK